MTGNQGRPKRAELIAEVLADPIARANTERYAAAAQGVLADLAGIGFQVDSVGALKLGAAYPEAVPVLVRWLPLVDYKPLKEDIVRTLSVAWASEAAAALIVAFEQVEDPTNAGLRWAVGNALEVLASDVIADDLLRLATDVRYGKARQMLVLGLRKLRDPRALEALLGLLDDDEVVGHAVQALGKLRASSARPRLEAILGHSNPWVQREAKKALARIAKRELYAGR